ncbi:SRPBCC family protein [Frondihabitans australicus]|uniref:Polyketide cyclase/dehydrase/lipid transport protein n=1 Tax=Frondihabitans australicus TaxID=386892 RepID=A0A495IDM6_9MICO|nr:SRPBCC family protein [Frondihabitans australicus]RKR73421.1 polyketide cyclase/dehydrase/lipid transport protein [Frondihabitans australicus]
MWTTSHTGTTTASPAAVWAMIEALHSGTKIGPESDTFELHGPFAVGTTLTVTPQGQDPMESTITHVEPERVYADVTVYGDITLAFRHDLAPLPGGGTTVTHTLVIDGAGSDSVAPELGPQISADFPAALAELFAAAEHGAPLTDSSESPAAVAPAEA